MMSILGESNKSRMEELAVNYVKWENLIIDYQNAKNNVGNELKSLMKLNEVDKVGRVKLKENHVLETLSISEIKEWFSGEAFIDNLVVKIDLEKTAKNLRLKQGLNETLVNAIINKIKGNLLLTVEELEVMGK